MREEQGGPSLGFTFVELVFVTLLLAILLVSAAPNFRGAWRGLEMERAAVDLAQMLRSARVLAITRGEPVLWRWEPYGNRARLEALHEQEDGKAAVALIEGRLGRARSVPGHVAVTVLRDAESVDTIEFFPDGTSDSTRLLFGDPRNPRYQIEVHGSTSQVALRK